MAPTPEGANQGAPESLSTLRGAPVEVNPRRVARVGAVLVLAALLVVVVVLFVAAAHRNAQVSALHTRGRPVVVTVTGCLGELGGSGSNAAGYVCRGTFALDGHRYNEIIPGDNLRPPGTKVRAVTVPGDPALLTTAGAAAHDRPTWHVYVLPGALAVVLVILSGATWAVARRRPRDGP